MTSKTAVQIEQQFWVIGFSRFFRVFYTACCVYCTWCNVMWCRRLFQVYGSQQNILYQQHTAQYTISERLLLMLNARYWSILFYRPSVLRCVRYCVWYRNETKPKQHSHSNLHKRTDTYNNVLIQCTVHDNTHTHTRTFVIE